MTIIKFIEFDFALFIVKVFLWAQQTKSKLIYEIYKREQGMYNVLDFNRLHICSICALDALHGWKNCWILFSFVSARKVSNWNWIWLEFQRFFGNEVWVANFGVDVSWMPTSSSDADGETFKATSPRTVLKFIILSLPTTFLYWSNSS